MPERAELPARLESVLRVIYLVFNEGYSASAGASLTRTDLCAEAIRLGRLLYELLPDVEVAGLLALMLLHDARRAARTDAYGELVRLDEQDRSLWDRQQIAEGALLVQRALSTRAFGPYALQAAIVAVHEAPSAAQTDWTQIVRLYDVLLQFSPSAVVELNRAVAVAMRDGAEAGLLLVDALLAQGHLQDYHQPRHPRRPAAPAGAPRRGSRGVPQRLAAGAAGAGAPFSAEAAGWAGQLTRRARRLRMRALNARKAPIRSGRPMLHGVALRRFAEATRAAP